MGYVFMFLSVLANMAKGYCSKQISTDVEGIRECTAFNRVRMALCCVLGLGYTFFLCGAKGFAVSVPQLMICAMSGIAMAIFVVSWTIAIKTGAYMMISATSSSAFVIPCLFGVFLLGEKLTWFKLLSFLLCVIALYFLLRYNTSFHCKLSKKEVWFLSLVFVTQGLQQACQKLYTYYFPGADVSGYSFYTFVFAFLALLVYELCVKNEPKPNRDKIKKNAKYLVIMAVAIFLVTYLQSLASALVEAIILYPMLNALSLIGGSLMASICFKEKMRRDCVIGIVCVFLSLMFARM